MGLSEKARREILRERMLRAGVSYAEVADEMCRQFRVRRRTGWRYALGWEMWKVAQEYMTANPGARVDVPRISRWESWPIGKGASRPSLHDLAGLAMAFGHGCSVVDLVDQADLAEFSAAERRLIASVTGLRASSTTSDGPGQVAEHKHLPQVQRSMLEHLAFVPAPGGVAPGRVLAVVGASDGPRVTVPVEYRSGAPMRLEAPAGQYFAGTRLDILALPATGGERIVGQVPLGVDLGTVRVGTVAAAAVEGEDGPRLYAMDARRLRRRANEGLGRASFPTAYAVDDLTLGVLWAVTNLDESLLDDDGALDRSLRTMATYEALPSSTATSANIHDLSPVSEMWLGSQFCADHIRRHSDRLTAQPNFWTREQRGEEASAWLLFAHKLHYLRTYAGHAGTELPQRSFCVPASTVAASSRPERVLLFLAAALMESFRIQVNVIDAPEYASVPGFVTDSARRAIVATWVGAESLWHVDVPDQRPTLREFSDALGFARAHSVAAGPTPSARLEALVGYLGLNWAWLVTRCAELGEYGAAGLISPRSRLLSTEGVDRACQFVGSFAAAR